MKKKLIKLHGNCCIVEGINRAIIIDLQRPTYHLVPLSLVGMFDNKGVLKVDLENSSLNQDEIDIFNSYIEFLMINDLIFELDSDEIDNFPKINFSWDYPALISNAIIDIDSFDINSIKRIFMQFQDLGIKHIEIRFFNIISNHVLYLLNKLVIESQLYSIRLLLKYSDNLENSIFSLSPKINAIILHNASENRILRESKNFSGLILAIEEKILNSTQCGQIHYNYFSSQISHFTEAQQYNTCLNRKIAIDAEGNIKNCPSMTKCYGNIRDTTLMEAIEKPGFKDCWTIRKDDTVKCRDCEFRYICTDCRAYTDDPEHALTPDAEGLYSSPLKCGYDPYTCTWEEWSTHPLKQKAIDFYEMRDIL